MASGLPASMEDTMAVSQSLVQPTKADILDFSALVKVVLLKRMKWEKKSSTLIISGSPAEIERLYNRIHWVLRPTLWREGPEYAITVPVRN